MKTILVVEDESGPADGLVEVLRQEGYRPVLARDGKEGLARCDEAGFARRLYGAGGLVALRPEPAVVIYQ